MPRPLRPLLLMALGCAAAFVAVALAAYATTGGARLDRAALEGFVELQGPTVYDVTWAGVQLGDPSQVAAIGALLAGLAVARGRPRVAVLVVLLLVGTSVSSQVLKTLLAHPRDSDVGAVGQVYAEALPSGHSTAAMALALAVVLVAPRRARPAAALLGAALALWVGASTVSLGWHFPSDVLAGYLLASGWALVLVAALRVVDRRWPAPVHRGRPARLSALVERASANGMTVGASAVVLTALAAGLLVFATHARELADYGRDYTAAIGVAMALTAAAIALPSAIAAALRRA